MDDRTTQSAGYCIKMLLFIRSQDCSCHETLYDCLHVQYLELLNRCRPKRTPKVATVPLGPQVGADTAASRNELIV